MSVSVSYDENDRLTLAGLECDCACHHEQPAQDIYMGKDLLARVPSFIEARGLGRRCVLVADDITYEVAGRSVEETLVRAGFEVIPCVVRREDEMLPDETACGEVLLSILPDTEFLISVGSGSVTDITRINATRTKLPFVSVGTAPSMDGYTSVVAPLLLRRVKIQRAGVCPDIIVCDLDVMATAPLAMAASGAGDVLGKYIANADWLLGTIINGEPYCPVCASLVMGAAAKILDNVDEIARKTETGMRALVEALILSGLSILIIGHSRAAASIEHNIAQYWEMQLVQRGRIPPKHGAAVGVATLLVWPLFRRFASEDLSLLDLGQIQRNRISREERERWMVRAFGEEGGRTIMRENPEDFLTWEEQERRIRVAQARFPEIRAVIEAMPPQADIEHTLRTLHGDMTPDDEGIGPDLLDLSLRCGKDYRSRYTLLKLLDECGLLAEYLAAPSSVPGQAGRGSGAS
ncbi:MAG: sn-glycerol-1-phosphate dehydrogenase [Actinomycetia bacterium]|nr:sn-glycerol-1-phosphate dehydrogenase [Actinomycetes bacterium]